MKMLITGGSGFVGSHFVERLSKDNEVYVLGKNKNKKFSKQFNCNFLRGDITKQHTLKAPMKGIDECYHLAANIDIKDSYDNPTKNFEINCGGTVNVLESCRKNDVKRFIFSSSAVVYGNTNSKISENAEVKPVNIYGAGKAASENYIMSYCHLYGMKGTILRYANIIGSGTRHGVVYDFYKKLKQNPCELEFLGDGTQARQYIHIKDAVDASIFAKEHTNRDWEIFNVGGLEDISVKKIADLIVRHLNLKDVNYKYSNETPRTIGDIHKSLLSIRKLRRIGWKPKYNIKQAISDTLNYLDGEESCLQ